MSRDAEARPPAYVYGVLYHPEGATVVQTSEDALVHALAVQRVARLMMIGMSAPNEEEDGYEELLAHVSLYGWLWTRRASEFLAAERAATVKPEPTPVSPPPGVVPIRRGKGGLA